MDCLQEVGEAAHQSALIAKIGYNVLEGLGLFKNNVTL